MPLTSLLHGAPQLHYWQKKQQVVEALHSLMKLRFNKANFMVTHVSTKYYSMTLKTIVSLPANDDY